MYNTTDTILLHQNDYGEINVRMWYRYIQT